jgi:hypothetical protein
MVAIRWIKTLPAVVKDKEGGWTIVTGASERTPFVTSKETTAQRRPRRIDEDVGKKHTVTEALSKTGDVRNIIK